MRPTRVVYLCLGLGLAFACAAALSATTYTVTTTADAGAGSLRQALTDATGAAGPHTIAFNIPGTGPHTIALASDLPNVNVDAGLTIDGTTQPGFAGTPQIEIHHDGTFSSQCLRFILTPVTIKALAINRCGTAINSTSGGSLTLLGSRLGTDPSGTVALGNAIGVNLSNGSAANVIGGPNSGDRNILSAHTSNAIQFAFNSGGTVRGNSIGVDATGTVAMGNFIGVNCSSSNAAVIVGGGGAGQGNIISGNTEKAILLQTCQNAVVQGNLIGTDVTGTLPIPNNEGIEANGSTNLEIGGTGAGEGNVIAASVEQGIRLGTAGATVQGNFIGTDESGTAALGNGMGIEIPFGTTTLVGPDTPGGPGANVIAYNILGVVDKGTSTTVRGNSIHDNKFLGLDTGTPLVNANDAGDADNGQPNFPNVTSAVVEGAGVRIIGILESNASSSFDLDFYSNPACSRFPQDYFEGETWIGTTPVTTDGSGHAAFNVLLSPVTVPPGFRVSATSTTADGSTSEFSQQIVLSSAGLTGNTGGGSVLNIGGMQFENGATVAVGGVPATNVQWLGATNITALAPALPAGSINAVTVTNPSGLSGTLPNAYVSAFADADISWLPAVHRRSRGERPDGRMRRAQLLPAQPRHAPADGGLSAARQEGPLLHAAAVHGDGVRRRALHGQRLRSLDRGARGPEHHRRLRRRSQLLPDGPGQSAADGGVSPESAGGVHLPAAGVHGRDIHRRPMLQPVFILDLRDRPAPDHGRLRRQCVLSGDRRQPPADGGVSGQDVRAALLIARGVGLSSSPAPRPPSRRP